MTKPEDEEPKPVVERPVSNPDSERVKLWRKSFPERYRAYQREYMRKRRMNGHSRGEG